MIFRRQSLEESEQVRFTEHVRPLRERGPQGHPVAVSRGDHLLQHPASYADGRFVGGFAGGDDVDWHSDQTYQVRPATGAMLYGIEVPQRRRRHLLGQPVRRVGPPARRTSSS